MEASTTINKVELQGFLGRDAEVKTFETGHTKISLSLATSESYKNNKGDWVTSTTWHNVIYWKTKKEESFSFLKKGELVSVNGKLCTRKYTDKNGQDKYITEVIALKLEPAKIEVSS
jgi:single-strand DNA-binding protein